MCVCSVLYHCFSYFTPWFLIAVLEDMIFHRKTADGDRVKKHSAPQACSCILYNNKKTVRESYVQMNITHNLTITALAEFMAEVKYVSRTSWFMAQSLGHCTTLALKRCWLLLHY